MRITIDIDETSPFIWAWKLLRGIYYCKKLPGKIRRTERGIHIIWYDVEADYQEMYKLRKLIQDDENRIRLDNLSEKRITQVLFKEKTITCNGYMHPVWFKIIGEHSPSDHFDICPYCNRKIDKSQKMWTDEKKAIIIHHGNTKCSYPLR